MVATSLDVTWSIPIGTPVYDVDGDHVGAVRDADVYALIVERGLFFTYEYRVAMAEVDRLEEGKIFLRITKAEVLDGGRD